MLHWVYPSHRLRFLTQELHCGLLRIGQISLISQEHRVDNRYRQNIDIKHKFMQRLYFRIIKIKRVIWIKCVETCIRIEKRSRIYFYIILYQFELFYTWSFHLKKYEMINSIHKYEYEITMKLCTISLHPQIESLSDKESKSVS